jgi:hypothetical protein
MGVIKERFYQPFLHTLSFLGTGKPLQNLNFAVIKVPNPLMGDWGARVMFPVISMVTEVKPFESRERYLIGVITFHYKRRVSPPGCRLTKD